VFAKLRALRPSHATVVAYLALFAALGGSSYAAVKLSDNSVRSRHIKNGQVKRADIGANAVDSARVRNGSLRAGDFAAGQLPRGPKGDQGAQGIQGPPGPVDGFTRDEATSRFVGFDTVTGFRVAPNWRTTSGGVTTTPLTGRTEFDRTGAGTVTALLPLSLPTNVGGRRVRPTAARVCFFQTSPGSSITAVGGAIGSGASPADDAFGESVSLTSQSGCLTIDVERLIRASGRPNGLNSDLAIDLSITATTTGSGGRTLLLGPADLTLTPDAP
jgi:hypothetical protein